MQVGEYLLSVDTVSKFHNSLFISGWFHHEVHYLTGVALIDSNLRSVVSQTGIRYEAIERDLGPNKGFFVQALRSTDRLGLLDELEVIFFTSNGESIKISVGDLVTDRAWHNRSHALSDEFVNRVRTSPGAKLLDVGGRSRSRVDRSQQFPGVETVVLDIVPGDNVDIVGDAHELSRLFPEGHFDFVYSVSVFEHLAMPWKVVCEMNRIMKTGALGLVHSHQTIGMHDVPWDFYRFSDTAWSSLFNGQTGFELLGSVTDDPQYVIPFLYKAEKENAEQSAGFESSTVMFRKTGPCRVSWDVSLSEIVDTVYPQA